MTQHTSRTPTLENHEEFPSQKLRDHTTKTKAVKVSRTVVVDARSKEQEQLHKLADKSGSDILDTLRSSLDDMAVEAGLAQLFSMANDGLEVAFDEGVPKPGELVPDDLAKTITQYDIVYIPVDAVRDERGRSHAIGKRKDAIARVWISPGSGKFTVNGKEMKDYFPRPVLHMIVRQPFLVAGVENQFDVMATVNGGGLSGQAGAVKHGISKALKLYDPSLGGALKAAGFLTRDDRGIERKKYGKHKMRRSFQFSKG